MSLTTGRSLTSCLSKMRKAGLVMDADDRAAIMKRASELRAAGSSAIDAGRQAVRERDEVVAALVAQEEAAQRPGMAADMRDQASFLEARARAAGYADLDAWVDGDYAAFERAASEWRAANPAEDWEPAQVSYSRRTKPDPQKTVTAYKLFRVDERQPGKLFPLFVNANDPVEIGVWLDAEIGPQAAGGKVKSKLGPLAFRPGWHAGDLPIATHIGEKSSASVKAPDRRPANQVWAEVEMAADVDWQTEANRRGTNANGRLVPVKAHITDRMPEDGFYRYKTNANMTGNWLIGGTMRVKRVLSDAEVKAVNDAAGAADLPRATPLDPGRFGLSFSGRSDAAERQGYDTTRLWYHGTTSDVGEFTRIGGGNMWGPGYYLTDNPDTASGYAMGTAGARIVPEGNAAPNVMQLYVKRGELFDMKAALTPAVRKRIEEALGESTADYTWSGMRNRDLLQVVGQQFVSSLSEANAVLRKAGFIGIVEDGNAFAGPGRTLMVFDGRDIKSATGNRGTFDPASASLSMSGRAGGWLDSMGRIQLAPGAWLYGKVAKVASAIFTPLRMNMMPQPLKRQVRAMKLQIEQAKTTASTVAAEMFKMADADRKLVSDIIEQELAAGVAPPAHAARMASGIQAIMDQQTNDLVSLGMLSQEAADEWRGKYLPRFYESKLRQALDPWVQMVKKVIGGRPAVMSGIGGKSLRGRGLWEEVPADELQDWIDQGWQVRDKDYVAGQSETVQVWRDFTREERDKMGEIRDAGFRFVMGYMRTQRDIALGRLFEGIASNRELSSKKERPGWRQVPDSTVEGTGVKRYGKLAGMWVPQDVLNHLGNIDGGHSEMLRMYRKAMGAWKEGKTVLNPVSHANNVMSNVTMAHFAGVSYWDAHKYAGAIMDLAKGRPLVDEARKAGLFLGTMTQEELLQDMPPELRAMAAIQESKTERAAGWVWNALSLWLRKPAGWAYEHEDLFFRYVIYRDARNRGLSPEDAVDYSQRYVFTYDDLPETAQRIRDFAMPFFAYTYKFTPAFIHTALHYPHRLAAPAAAMWALNAAMYAMAAGEDDEEWDERIMRYIQDPERRAAADAMEDQERKNLPPWMRGMSMVGAPKAVRLGVDEVTGLPLFWDIAQIMPGGNMWDIQSNTGGIPWIQSLTPSHPLLSTFSAMFMNKDSFFGKEIVDDNDTSTEAAAKRAEWLWLQLTPAIAVGNYHSTRLANVVAQMTGEPVQWVWNDATGFGRDGLPVQPKLTAMQTFGLKVRPVDLEMSAEIEEGKRKRLIRDIDAELRRLRKLNDKGAISDRQLEAETERAQLKKDRLREGLTVDGDER